MKRFLHAGEGYALFQGPSLQTTLHQTDKTFTDNIRLYSSTTQERYGSLVRPWFRQAAGLMPVALVCFRARMGSTISRLLTGISSALSRSPLEAESKPTRRIVEAESNKCRRTVEQVSNKSRRNRVSCNLFSIRTSCIYLGLFFMCLQAAIAKEPAPETDRAVLVADSIRPLQVGDTIPDYLWDLPFQVVNHPEGRDVITLSDYKGKLIILDFWATWCSSCIKSFPRVYELNDQFSDELMIIPVNSDPRELNASGLIGEFLRKRNVVYQLPSILDHQNILYQLSGHRTIPHLLWIRDGKLIGITKSEALSKTDLASIIRGESPPPALIELVDWNTELPLFHNGNGSPMPDSFISRSVLSEYEPGMKRHLGVNTDEHGNVSGIYASNVSVGELYRMAFPEIKDYLKSRIVFADGVSEKMLGIEGFESRVNYNLQCPSVSKSRALAYMQQDLIRAFGVRPEIIKREITSLVLNIDDGPALASTQNTRRETNIYEEVSGPKFYHNGRFPSLVRHLNQTIGMPVIDETGYELPVSLDLPEDLRDMHSLIAMFNKQGFTAVLEKRMIDMVVFSMQVSLFNL